MSDKFYCSECDELMNYNEFINNGGICAVCLDFKQKELENNTSSSLDELDERDYYDIEYDH